MQKSDICRQKGPEMCLNPNSETQNPYEVPVPFVRVFEMFIKKILNYSDKFHKPAKI